MNTSTLKTAIAALALLGNAGFASDIIKTTDGTVYKDAEVTGFNAYELAISYVDGLARIPFAKLPAEIQHRYNYDPTEAAKVSAQIRADKAANWSYGEQAQQAQEEAKKAEITAEDAEKAKKRAEQVNKRARELAQQRMIAESKERTKERMAAGVATFLPIQNRKANVTRFAELVADFTKELEEGKVK